MNVFANVTFFRTIWAPSNSAMQVRRTGFRPHTPCSSSVYTTSHTNNQTEPLGIHAPGPGRVFIRHGVLVQVVISRHTM